MKLIYRTRIQKPNKYERFHNEYYKNGDIIEKYTLSSTRVPGHHPDPERPFPPGFESISGSHRLSLYSGS